MEELYKSYVFTQAICECFYLLLRANNKRIQWQCIIDINNTKVYLYICLKQIKWYKKGHINLDKI